MEPSKILKLAKEFEMQLEKLAATGSRALYPTGNYGNVKPELLDTIVGITNNVAGTHAVGPFYSYSLSQDPNSGAITMTIKPMAESALAGYKNIAKQKLKQQLEARIPQLTVSFQE